MHFPLCSQQPVKALFHSNCMLPDQQHDSTATTCLVSTFHSNYTGLVSTCCPSRKGFAVVCFPSSFMLTQHLHACTASTWLQSIYMLAQHLHASTASICFDSEALAFLIAACRSSWLFWDYIYWLIEWLLLPHTRSSKAKYFLASVCRHCSTI